MEALRGETSDDDLMVRVAAKEHVAFAILMERHIGRVHALASRVMEKDQDADDICQDVFLKIWRQAPRWQADHSSGARFTTWLYKVALNEALAQRRRRRLLAPFTRLLALASSAAGPETRLARRQRAESIVAAVHALPDRWQQAILLTYSAGLSNGDAADVMGLSVKAFESLLVRAKARLRRDVMQEQETGS